MMLAKELFMQTVQRYIWEVIPTSTPLIRKRCNKCNCQTSFYCSNKFRLNSQKKYMDIWLIYRCKDCDTTHNLSILSRVNPNTLNSELFQRFNDNDETLAWQYAFDSGILLKNKVEVDYSNIEYDIVRQNQSLQVLTDTSSDLIEFEIKAFYCLALKVSSVIRICLDISNSQLDKMLDTGVLILHPAGVSPKHKVKNGMKIMLDCSKLQVW